MAKKAKKLGVGIVGIGFMGSTHYAIHKASKRSEVVAICDTDNKKLKGDWSAIGGNIGDGSNKLEDLSGINAYTKLDDLLKDPKVDVVDITLPTYLHADAAIKALKAGKHVMCEKPMAINSKEAKRMLAVSKKSKGKFMIGHCIRFWPEYAYLKDLVDNKKYGKVLSCSLRRISPMPTWTWQNWMMDTEKCGSAALDLHIHDADYVRFLFGKVQSVTAMSAVPTKKKGAQHMAALYSVKNGACVTVEGGFACAPTYGFNMNYTVIFEKATVDFTTSTVEGQSPLEVHLNTGKKLTPSVKKYQTGGVTGWDCEIDYFLKCCQTGAAITLNKPEDSLLAVELIEAEVKSATTGKTVKKVI